MCELSYTHNRKRHGFTTARYASIDQPLPCDMAYDLAHGLCIYKIFPSLVLAQVGKKEEIEKRPSNASPSYNCT